MPFGFARLRVCVPACGHVARGGRCHRSGLNTVHVPQEDEGWNTHMTGHPCAALLKMLSRLVLHAWVGVISKCLRVGVLKPMVWWVTT